ncbi:hypothetical protein J7E76_20370 [Bacillus sp. ISL-101]|uniref:hypothetical protein n=1 Tax=Bacillus sp. ISL-101 TaxID=2819117 RepID=UPI001BEAF17D|nr:hypothetical protein [Bacillus sp. ISL-101]MBT2631430.1 hypothetical protein [Bacillus sp. ISL-101]
MIFLCLVRRKNAAITTITMIVVRRNAAITTITMIVVRRNAAMTTITKIVVRKNAAIMTFGIIAFGVIGSLLNGKYFDTVLDQGTFFY